MRFREVPVGAARRRDRRDSRALMKRLAGIGVIGLQEVRLPSQLVVREGLSWSRHKLRVGVIAVVCGCEHLTVVHSSPSVLMVAVRSETLEANVVVAHSLVKGDVRAEALWEALEELLTAFANDVPTYACIDANGRLGS